MNPFNDLIAHVVEQLKGKLPELLDAALSTSPIAAALVKGEKIDVVVTVQLKVGS